MPFPQRCSTALRGPASPAALLLLAALLAAALGGCAGPQAGGTYHYAFERHREITVSSTFTYLGRFQTTSDAATFIGGVQQLLNRCRGSVLVDVYYRDTGDVLEEVLLVYRDTVPCPWKNAESDAPESRLQVCADADNRYVSKIRELAEGAGKKLMGCYQGLSKYGYVGRKTLHLVYLFVAESKLVARGQHPEDSMQELFSEAVSTQQ